MTPRLSREFPTDKISGHRPTIEIIFVYQSMYSYMTFYKYIHSPFPRNFMTFLSKIWQSKESSLTIGMCHVVEDF